MIVLRLEKTVEDGKFEEVRFGLVDFKAGPFILFTLVAQYLGQCMCSIILVDCVTVVNSITHVEHQWRNSLVIAKAK